MEHRISMLTSFVALILTTAAVQATPGELGVDVSKPFDDSSQWSCLHKSANRSWGVVRAWHSFGAFDTNAPSTLAAASAAGMPNLDVYLFPCSSKSAKSQVSGLMTGLKSSSFSSVWIDVETNPSDGCGWSTDLNKNCKYLETMVNALTETGTAVGIYSSHFEWTSVMGTACEVANHLPLWYARYSYGPSCVDYKNLTFGGWSKPFAKQYADAGDAQASACGFHSADVSVLC